MLQPAYSNKVQRDTVLAKKRGKDLAKLRWVIEALLKETPLPVKYRNHKLKGEFAAYWECHLEPDWLLIYEKGETEIFFARTGTHSDLF